MSSTLMKHTESLSAGKSLSSPNGKFVLSLEESGNLVLYSLSASLARTLLWQSNTAQRGVAPYRLLIQNHGLLAIHDAKNTCVWCSSKDSVFFAFTGIATKTTDWTYGSQRQNCFLDRQTVRADTGHFLLGFRLQNSGENVRFEYTQASICATKGISGPVHPVSLGNAREHVTDWQPGAELELRFLDRQRVFLEENRVLTGFHLEREGPNIRYRYWSAQLTLSGAVVSLGDAVLTHTAYQPGAMMPICFLDRQHVQAEPNCVLTGFRVACHPGQVDIRYEVFSRPIGTAQLSLCDDGSVSVIGWDGNVSWSIAAASEEQVKASTQLAMSSDLPISLQAAYALYSLNAAEEAVNAARAARAIAKIKSATTQKKVLEESVRNFFGVADGKDLYGATPAASDFVSIEKKDITKQHAWVLNRLNEFIEELCDAAEFEEDFERLERAERVKVALEESSPQPVLPSQPRVFPPPPPSSESKACRVSQRVGDGRCSSDECLVVDALYTTGFIANKEVKAKLRPMSGWTSMQHEFRIMSILHEASPRRFVKPYELICGWDRSSSSSGCVLVSDCGEDLSQMCGIVMERGHESLADYLERKGDSASRLDLLRIAEVLVDILIAAHKANIVLLDFKPGNVVRCFDENHEIVWKAIDFDGSRHVGERIGRTITAQYGCFEVAQFVLSPSNTAAPRATKAMDICSLGWIVWKMMAGHRSLWDELGLSGENDAILAQLARLTEAELAKHIGRSFPGERDAPLRRFLEDALCVDPLRRPAATALKLNYSLLGHKDGTMNMDIIAKRIEERVDKSLSRFAGRLIDRIDELSVEMKQQFVGLQSSLDNASVTLAAQGETSAVNDLIALLEEQCVQAQQGRLDMNHALAQMRSLNESLQTTVVGPISDALRTADSSVSQSDKLDAILEMMHDMKGQLDEIQSAQKQQLDLLSEIERRGNFMPHLFCVIPEVRTERLDKSASSAAKAVNWMKRVSESVMRVAWTRSRLVFICPVTLQMVPCGLDGKGYLIEMPTDLVRKAVPVLKIGLTLVKIALATQGMGNVVPNVADFLPSSFDADALSEVLSQMTETSLALCDSNMETVADASSQLDTLQGIFKLVAKAEGCDLSCNANLLLSWKPQRTGLLLTKSAAQGTFAWVCEAGMESFNKYGQKAFKAIGK